jgi:hypothetical protein
MPPSAQQLVPPPAEAAVEVDDDRAFEPVSVRGPALVVLGIAVAIVLVGTVASALDSGRAPAPTVHHVTIPDGTVVPLVPGRTALRSIVSAGQPPADIIGNLAVPAGSPAVRTVDVDQGVSQFDRTVSFTGHLATDQVADVYRTLLPRLGWKVIYDGAQARQQGPGSEVLAKRGSGDGFYWEVGVVVSPTTSTGTTPFSLELFELSDDN